MGRYYIVLLFPIFYIRLGSELYIEEGMNGVSYTVKKDFINNKRIKLQLQSQINLDCGRSCAVLGAVALAVAAVAPSGVQLRYGRSCAWPELRRFRKTGFRGCSCA